MFLNELKYLGEARKNPEKNLQKTTYQEMLPYKEDEDVFISFTTVDKIGINPQTDYNTPAGIYTYPLKKAWKEYDVDGINSFRKFPFAQHSPYIYVLKIRESAKVIRNINDPSVYTNSNLKTDIDHLLDIYPEECTDLIGSEVYQEWKEYNEYNGIREYLINLIKDYLNDEEEYHYGRIMWYFTHKLAETIVNSSKASVKWNSILRNDLEYDVIIDFFGGIIHRNEPLQAIFLTKTAFEVIDRVENKKHSIRQPEQYHGQEQKLIRSLLSHQSGKGMPKIDSENYPITVSGLNYKNVNINTGVSSKSINFAPINLINSEIIDSNLILNGVEISNSKIANSEVSVFKITSSLVRECVVKNTVIIISEFSGDFKNGKFIASKFLGGKFSESVFDRSSEWLDGQWINGYIELPVQYDALIHTKGNRRRFFYSKFSPSETFEFAKETLTHSSYANPVKFLELIGNDPQKPMMIEL